MRFRDFTVINGLITARRAQDSDHLAPAAVEYCRETLRELRALPAGSRLQVCDKPVLYVAIGLPDGLDVNIDAHRFFTVAASKDDFPFQFNMVLPDVDWNENDYLSTGTLNVLSRLVQQTTPTELDAEEWPEEFRGNRPLLATTLIPFDPKVDRVRVMLAADFCTCFAAAMLLEEAADAA